MIGHKFFLKIILLHTLYYLKILVIDKLTKINKGIAQYNILAVQLFSQKDY